MLKLPSSGLTACVLAAAAFVTLHAAPPDPGRLVAIVGGVAVSPNSVVSIVVDSDAMQPDMARVEIEQGRPPFPGNSLSVNLEGVKGSGTIFKGEVVDIEPDAPGSQRIVIRAFNRLHRLTRARQTRTFEKMTDSEIASRIAEENELGFGPDFVAEASQRHDWVFQHHQTDLEFLRTRAARLGLHVWVDDTTLYFQRDGTKESVSLGLGCTAKPGVPTVGLRTFHPRLSSAGMVSKVTVRGWDPQKKEEIVGHASRRIIPLSDAAATLLSPPGQSLDLGTTFALDANAGAYGAANGALSALTAEDISAEVITDPSAAIRPRILIAVDASGSMNFVTGKYYITAVRHGYRPGAQGGMLSFGRLLSADRGMYVLPELGDDAYVAFEHGDIKQPIVVGSVWNGTDTTHEKPFCGN